MSNTTTPAAASSIHSKSKNPKRGLRLEKDFFINLDNVCGWTHHPEHMQFQLTDQNVIDIYLENSESIPHSSQSHFKINEFKRIERELAEYMGI